MIHEDPWSSPNYLSPPNWAKTPIKLHTGFVPLAATKLEKQHVTAPLAVLQCLNGAGGKAVPTQNLGKHHLVYVWPLTTEMRKKKEF